VEERTLTVKGTGQASLPPDTIQLDFDLESKAENYDETINLAGTRLEQLRSCLANVGFSKSDLVTTNFSVNTDYESVKNEEGEYIRVFKGYSVRNNLKLSFPIDTHRLAMILEQLSACEANPELSIHFLLTDDTKLKELLLQDAVADATQKANILALAAGVRLDDILAITYDWSNIVYRNREMMLEESVAYSAAAIDIQPDNVSASDTVTIVWEIK
jgi:hypothetical protein